MTCCRHLGVIDDILREASLKFGEAKLTRSKKIRLDHSARAEVMTQLYERGLPIQQIALALDTTLGAVQVALGLDRSVIHLDDDDLDLDEDDELDEVPALRGPTRMLPVLGARHDCALASECLGELLRACAPAAPRAASCPTVCPAFQPPGRPERGQLGAGIGGWDDSRMPPDPDPDADMGTALDPDAEDARCAKIRKFAVHRQRVGGRFVRVKT